EASVLSLHDALPIYRRRKHVGQASATNFLSLSRRRDWHNHVNHAGERCVKCHVVSEKDAEQTHHVMVDLALLPPHKLREWMISLDRKSTRLNASHVK